MCKYCDYASDDCEIFIDPLDNEWYLDIETYEWDEYDDGYVHQRLYISYCPYCGRKLKSDTGKWIKIGGGVITPGGDPAYRCSVCGNGEHVYGIESPHNKLDICPDCGSHNTYS